MRNRCKFHRLYAGKVRICERWNDFYAFLFDMGERPEGMSIDRFPNNHGDYEPGNCRWATQTEQIANSEQIRSSEAETLHPDAIEEIRKRFAAGEAYQDLMIDFARSQVTIHRIARGKPSMTPDQSQDALAAINAMRRRRPKKDSE